MHSNVEPCTFIYLARETNRGTLASPSRKEICGSTKQISEGKDNETLEICLVITLLLLSAATFLSQHALAKDSDVDAIGQRDIDKHQINFISLDKEIALGKQLAAEVERTSKLITDPVITEYVTRIGQNLVRNSDAKVPLR